MLVNVYSTEGKEELFKNQYDKAINILRLDAKIK